ncbi:MAG: SH3 domain-containing protein [Pseudomonadota bacterium]|uniref:SH3 domain-containing protein n=1 Tax=Roseovarius TaxID=74030 RepID=UPI0022A8484D|nr:SH3 domain-containing protein [Roseovarius sp. EGI FJ00037]MCZ0812299.1 SH3 domain-containing protein [Roseovarius sp. EGI FJ00037]
MWRFILVSFAFLGWSFYELSGGADYEPRTNSIQARAKLGDPRPVARPVRTQEPRVAQAPDIGAADAVARGLSDLTSTPTGGVKVALAADGASGESEVITAVAHNVVTRSVAQAPQRDLREVAASRVNMRAGPGTRYDRIARLERGDQVAVLRAPGNGWVKLRVVESGRVGWMAERLVTVSN